MEASYQSDSCDTTKKKRYMQAELCAAFRNREEAIAFVDKHKHCLSRWANINILKPPVDEHGNYLDGPHCVYLSGYVDRDACAVISEKDMAEMFKRGEVLSEDL